MKGDMNMKKHVIEDGIDRRGFLKCMAWAGAGVIWTISGGVPKSFGLNRFAEGGIGPTGNDIIFAQISDSHIGFNKHANQDVTRTFQIAVEKINALPVAPSFIIHTGDITHLSRPEEFDTVNQILKDKLTKDVFYAPGEHDVLGDDGKQYLKLFGKGTNGDGWYSFNHGGLHFIGLVNVLNLKPGGLGNLGTSQLEWLKKDLRDLPSSTPIVIFAHIPLWSVYPDWGWGTDDSAQALSYLKRFGSVTVLNGHIHQVLQKVEGNITFHTANSTAFPQPEPGKAPSPGPLTVPAEKLRNLLGLTTVNYIEKSESLAIVDSSLE